MKMKLIASCFALTAFMASQVYAVDIYKGKILQHKEWSTGKGKVIFKEIKNKNLRSNVGEAIASFSTVDVVYGTVGVPVEVQGTSSGYIKNTTDSPQIFSFNTAVCAETNPFNTECLFYYDRYELEPGGHVHIEGIQPSISATFADAGEHNIFVSTQIEGVSRVGSESVSKAIITLGK